MSAEAAPYIARHGRTVVQAAREHEVMEEVARFRSNVTAAFRRVA